MGGDAGQSQARMREELPYREVRRPEKFWGGKALEISLSARHSS